MTIWRSGTTSTDAPVRTRSPTSNVILEAVLQGFICSIIIIGWYFAAYHVGVEWLIRRHRRYVFGGLYVTTVNILVALMATLNLYLCSGKGTHGVPTYNLPDKEQLTEPYPCINCQGDLAVCSKGSCRGRWKPPRTHHCSSCGVCRLEFDHHCPWVGNCVTLPRLKAFVLFLYLVPLAFCVSVSPVMWIFIKQLTIALQVSKEDNWANEVWWSWLGSWIFCAGPLGRWVFGTLLGFYVMKGARPHHAFEKPGYLIEEPHLRVVITVIFAFLFSIFCLALAFGCTKRISQGVTTLETLVRPPSMSRPSSSGIYHCVSFPADSGIGFTMHVLPSERMYDMGMAANWKAFMRRPIFERSTPSSYVWPKLNPGVLHRMRALQRHDSDAP